ncbi:MAG TPA: phage protein NinX family protein [Arsenophonus nasoniae]|uniref:phage protein NinX family protein n=1 Tax=Arsenophonus nasoniae TaxID=638 RepID=UPI0038792915
MKIKTSELKGRELDWAVGKAENKEIFIGDAGNLFVTCGGFKDNKVVSFWKPTDCFATCDILIKKNDICLSSDGQHHVASAPPHTGVTIQQGETLLIAICRAVVAIKLGMEVDIPDELVGKNDKS